MLVDHAWQAFPFCILRFPIGLFTLSEAAITPKRSLMIGLNVRCDEQQLPRFRYATNGKLANFCAGKGGNHCHGCLYSELTKIKDVGAKVLLQL
jgi:hypothetical protein